MPARLALAAAIAVLAASLSPAPVAAAPDRPPNIILMLADDMGFSDLGCYGSEIYTPNLDQLAKSGVRLTQFYNCARCCPTRACLLTGLYPHQAGVGHMMEDYNLPGYRGNLSKESVTIAQVLQAAGYQTMMCGKWHVSRFTGPEGPKHNWPLHRGFDKFFGTLTGAGSYFDPATLMRDDRAVRPPEAKEFYYTEAIGEMAVTFLDQASRSSKPFFLYVAFTAPHWPLHAPDAVEARYRARYAMGWDELRKERRQRQIALGVVKAQWPLTPRDERVRDWGQNQYRSWQQRRMEVYAAQIDEMDRAVGRILEKVRQGGAEENTLVMFLSDNGGCAEEIEPTWRGEYIPTKTRGGRPVQVGNDPNILPGSEGTYQSYGIAWANASNTPFRLYKHWVHEGGIATPLIASWPAVIPGGNRLAHEPGHVVDLMATCLAAARAAYPAHFGGHAVTPTSGKSLLPLFTEGTRLSTPIFWEHEGNRAVRDGKWKLVSRYPGDWELYDMEADRTEMHNLAEKFPVVVQEMAQTYAAWAKRTHVEPWRGGGK